MARKKRIVDMNEGKLKSVVTKLKAIKSILKVSFFLCFLGILIQTSAAKSTEAQNDWLIGSWLLTYDPDGDPQDMLSFYPEGKFLATEVLSQRSIQGIYEVKQGIIEIAIGQSFEMQLAYDEVKDKLYFYSKETQKTSHYTKQN